MSQTPPPPPQASAGNSGAVGQLRKPLTVVLLSLVTCGIYYLWWYFRNFDDMKDYSGEGVGGGIGLLLAIFCGIIAIFVLPAEVGNLYEREGKDKPISALAAFWNLIPLIGTFIYIYKVQGRINDFWGPKGGTWAGSD
jgi:hypothetical protein